MSNISIVVEKPSEPRNSKDLVCSDVVAVTAFVAAFASPESTDNANPGCIDAVKPLAAKLLIRLEICVGHLWTMPTTTVAACRSGAGRTG